VPSASWLALSSQRRALDPRARFHIRRFSIRTCPVAPNRTAHGHLLINGGVDSHRALGGRLTSDPMCASNSHSAQCQNPLPKLNLKVLLFNQLIYADGNRCIRAGSIRKIGIPCDVNQNAFPRLNFVTGISSIFKLYQIICVSEKPP